MNAGKDKHAEHELIAERRRKLTALRESGNPYPNDFRRNALSDELHQSCLSGERRRWAARESHGVRGSHYAFADERCRPMPDRPFATQEQGHGDEAIEGKTLRT